MSTPSLDSLRCFAEAARLLNFRAAARVVSLSPAALGARIKQLEDDIGKPLFHRTTRMVVLTEEGLALLPYAQNALSAAALCLRAGRGELGRAPMELTLGTRHELGISWILPMLQTLERAHPGLTLHLYFSSGSDLLMRTRALDIDLAVSSTRITDPKLDSLQLHTESYALVGAPGHLNRVAFRKMADAGRHTLIDISQEMPLFRYWRDAPGGFDSLHFAGLLRMGTLEAIRAVVLAEKGVAVLPTYFIKGDLEARRLKVVMPRVEPLGDHFRLVFRTDDPRRAFYQELAATMRRRPLA